MMRPALLLRLSVDSAYTSSLPAWCGVWLLPQARGWGAWTFHHALTPSQLEYVRDTQVRGRSSGIGRCDQQRAGLCLRCQPQGPADACDAHEEMLVNGAEPGVVVQEGGGVHHLALQQRLGLVRQYRLCCRARRTNSLPAPP